MIKRVIVAIILVVVLFVAWKVWHTCRTGKATGFFANVFAKTCHLFTG